MRGAALTLIYACVRLALAGFAGALIITVLPPGAAPGKAETMSSALARAYAGNPDLNQQRAGVRATDENLPRASSAWRPKASATGQYGYNYIDLTANSRSGEGSSQTRDLAAWRLTPSCSSGSLPRRRRTTPRHGISARLAPAPIPGDLP